MDKKKINDDALEEVSGGYIFLNDDVKYEIIDDKGDVVDTAYSWDDAVKKAERRGLNTKFIVWDELKAIREKNNK